MLHKSYLKIKIKSASSYETQFPVVTGQKHPRIVKEKKERKTSKFLRSSHIHGQAYLKKTKTYETKWSMIFFLPKSLEQKTLQPVMR